MQKLKELISQFVKFGLVGAVNTILTLVIQWAFLALGFHYLIGNTVSFLITVILAYILNNIFAFREKDGTIVWSFRAFIKVFLSYSITGLGVTSIGLWFWNDILNINPNISPILNLFVTIPMNFVLNKYWAYRKPYKEGVYGA